MSNVTIARIDGEMMRNVNVARIAKESGIDSRTLRNAELTHVDECDFNDESFRFYTDARYASIQGGLGVRVFLEPGEVLVLQDKDSGDVDTIHIG